MFTNFVIINIFCPLLEKYYITIFNRQIANKEKTDIHIFYPLLGKYYITIFNRQIANKEKNSSFETGNIQFGRADKIEYTEYVIQLSKEGKN